MSGTANMRTKNGNISLKELVQKFYWSNAPFWPVVNTPDYKSPRSCMSSIRSALYRMNAAGCISMRVFPNPNVEGNPDTVYLCTNEFASSGQTPAEWYAEKEKERADNYIRNDIEIAEEIAQEAWTETMENAKSTGKRHNWKEVVEDFYTSNETERFICEGGNAWSTTWTLKRLIATHPEFEGVVAVTENAKCMLRKLPYIVPFHPEMSDLAITGGTCLCAKLDPEEGTKNEFTDTIAALEAKYAALESEMRKIAEEADKVQKAIEALKSL